MRADLPARLRAAVRDLPDHPKPGVMFRDLIPALADVDLRREVFDALAAPASNVDAPTVVAGIEARGFLFGVGVAERLRLPFVPLRKPGKLPWKVVRQDYELEYGSDALEAHIDSVSPSDRVLIVDDVLATGGTAAAAGALIQAMGAEVAAYAFVIELSSLGGRGRLADVPVNSVLSYP